MAEPAYYEYCTVAALLTGGVGSLDDPPTVAAAHQAIRAAAAAINLHTHRVFTPYADTGTYDAPASPVLALDDWVTITTITVAETPVDGADWVPLTRAPAPASPYAQSSLWPHWGAVRTRAGAWSDLLARAAPLGAVAVAGTRGYAAAVPEAILILNRALALHLWHGDLTLWQESSGGAPSGGAIGRAATLITGELARLAQPYVWEVP